MTDLLPAVRTSTAVATRQPTQTASTQVKPALPLSIALLVSSGGFAVVVAVSWLVGRVGQAQLLAGAVLVMLFAAFVEWRRERRS